MTCLSRLGEVHPNLQAAQEDRGGQDLEGSAGGGKVRVRTTGGLEFQEVTIDPAVVDPGDVEMLQDLVLAAVRDASSRPMPKRPRRWAGSIWAAGSAACSASSVPCQQVRSR